MTNINSLLQLVTGAGFVFSHILEIMQHNQLSPISTDLVNHRPNKTKVYSHTRSSVRHNCNARRLVNMLNMHFSDLVTLSLQFVLDSKGYSLIPYNNKPASCHTQPHCGV